MAAERCSFGIAAIGSRKARCRQQEALAKGDLKFTLDGERLHGSFVLVRMKHDRNGGKRTNWLLIKHRDEHATDGNGDAILARGSIGRLRTHHGTRSPPAKGADRSRSCWQGSASG